MPFFNRQNNDDLILAVQSAGVTRGRNGFRKDKGGEKLAETEEDLLQHRTDGTDAFDTLYMGICSVVKYEVFASGLVAIVVLARFAFVKQDPPQKFPYRDHLSLSMGGVL